MPFTHGNIYTSECSKLRKFIISWVKIGEYFLAKFRSLDFLIIYFYYYYFISFILFKFFICYFLLTVIYYLLFFICIFCYLLFLICFFIICYFLFSNFYLFFICIYYFYESFTLGLFEGNLTLVLNFTNDCIKINLFKALNVIFFLIK